MGKIKTLIIVVVAAYVVFCGFRILFAFGKGFTKSEMDWNQDGESTIEEMLLGSDIEKRSTSSEDEECVEYYNLKTGDILKTLCN